MNCAVAVLITVALIVATPFVVCEVTVNCAVVLPCVTVTLAGTVATAVLLLDRVTTVPPEGAGWFSVTVAVPVAGYTTSFGLIDKEEMSTGDVNDAPTNAHPFAEL